MENFSRSKSTREAPEAYRPSSNGSSKSVRDLRSYSTSGYQNRDHPSDSFGREMKANNWNFNMDPELQRKKRVVGYKAYSVEGKMKRSLRKSFRWMKDVVVHGFW